MDYLVSKALPEFRINILEIANSFYPHPVRLQSLHKGLRSRGYDVHRHVIMHNVTYLKEKGYLVVIEQDDIDEDFYYSIKITDKGIDVLEKRFADPGVGR